MSCVWFVPPKNFGSRTTYDNDVSLFYLFLVDLCLVVVVTMKVRMSTSTLLLNKYVHYNKLYLKSCFMQMRLTNFFKSTIKNQLALGSDWCKRHHSWCRMFPTKGNQNISNPPYFNTGYEINDLFIPVFCSIYFRNSLLGTVLTILFLF